MRHKILVILAAVLLAFPTQAAGADGPTEYTGTVRGVPFLVEVPAGWNGTLLLFSHEHEESTVPLGDSDTFHPQVGAWLLAHGYALAGTNYANLTWTSSEMVHDQLALLDWFSRHVGRPRHTVAWGISIGAQVTAVLTQRHPARFDGALPMCGEMAGPISWYNGLLDIGFAIRTLLDPSLEVAHIADPTANQQRADAAVRAALNTPAGRARLALANAFDDVPGWVDSLADRPTDPDEQATEQGYYDLFQLGSYIFGPERADLEQQLGGNPAWNVGIDYRHQLARSTQAELVRTIYARAGLSLSADLAKLQNAPRIAPDPGATTELAGQGGFSGPGPMPTLTLHSIGDGTAPTPTERTYGAWRQLYVNRANHCLFTAAEELTALRTLLQRVRTGHWPATDPASLNSVANSYDETYRTMTSYYSGPPRAVPAAFVSYRPARWLR